MKAGLWILCPIPLLILIVLSEPLDLVFFIIHQSLRP